MIHIFDNIPGLLQSLVILIAAITGLFCYRKYKYSKIRFFIYILLYIACFQFIAKYTYSVRYNGVLSFLDTTIFRHNYWLSTLYWRIGAMLFYSWFFSKFIRRELYRKSIRLMSLLFLIFAVITIVTNFDELFSSSNVTLRIIGNLLLIVSISLYFIDILQSDKLLDFYKINIFYIASIVFLWLLITMPLGFYESYYNLEDLAYRKLRSTIYFYVNFFMYIGFSLVLIFGKPEKTIND